MKSRVLHPSFFTDEGEPLVFKDLIDQCGRKRVGERFLYRFFNEDDELLYVGITWNLGYRFLQHRQKKPWWSEVFTISSELYPTELSCREAERMAIHLENPKYNKSRPRLV